MKAISVFQERINELFRRHAYNMAAEGEKMTRQDYANRVGTTVNALRGWLAGTGQPDADGLARIASVEKVSVDWLVGKSPEPEGEAVGDPQRARLIKSIKEADLQTLAQLEQFYNYLEYQKNQSEQPAVPDSKAASR
ncbi:MAG: hypothetical protein IJU00_14875 [Selenomonas sp.]|nr:hypothetical protein [Selenomonas sp.]